VRVVSPSGADTLLQSPLERPLAGTAHRGNATGQHRPCTRGLIAIRPGISTPGAELVNIFPQQNPYLTPDSLPLQPPTEPTPARERRHALSPVQRPISAARLYIVVWVVSCIALTDLSPCSSLAPLLLLGHPAARAEPDAASLRHRPAALTPPRALRTYRPRPRARTPRSGAGAAGVGLLPANPTQARIRVHLQAQWHTVSIPPPPAEVSGSGRRPCRGVAARPPSGLPDLPRAAVGTALAVGGPHPRTRVYPTIPARQRACPCRGETARPRSGPPASSLPL